LLGERRLSTQLVFEAARLVLSHRMQHAFLRPAAETDAEIERVLRQSAEESGEARAGGTGEGALGDDDLQDMQVPGSTAAGSILLSLFDNEKKKKTGAHRLTRSSSDER
jgi:hypothetical protein